MKLNKLIKNQKGQGIMEYVIISSLIGVICLVAVKDFGGVIKKRVEYMQKRVVSEISMDGNTK